MIQKVLLPKLGQTVETSVIENWHVKEGDKVSKGDVLCEITTDKATLEVESYVKGTVLKIAAETGVDIPVNSIIALVGAEGEEIPASLLAEIEAGPAEAAEAAPAAATEPAEKPTLKVESKAEPAPAPAPKSQAEKPAAPAPKAAPAAPPAPAASAGRIFVSPRARKLAEGEYVPLNVLRGSGPNGRIVEADVADYLKRIDEAKITPLARKIAYQRGVDLAALAAGGTKVTREMVEAAPAAVASGAGAYRQPKSGQVKLTTMRRIIAQRMLQSKQEIPGYYLHMDVDLTDLMDARRKLNAKGDVKVSINDYFLVACGRALAEFPAVNSRWLDGGIEYRGECNVGLAVALEEGLIVPVVRNIEQKHLTQVAADSRSLIEKARGKKLLPEEFEGGSMTISNLGGYSVKHFIPVINPGESCIMGLGVIEDRVVVRQGGIHIRKMMTMTIAFDHRLVDGAVGAQFMERVRDLLEAPGELEK